MTTTHQEIPEHIRQWGDAASLAARVVNRFWLAAAVVSLVVVLPPAPDNGRVTLPLVGKVTESYFALASGLLLAATVVAFCAAYAHMIRVELLIRRTLGDPNEGDGPNRGRQQDLLDVSRLPTFGRVAPLAQLARGKYQFFEDKPYCPGWLRWSTAVLYVCLKIVSGAMYIGLPAYALFSAFRRFAATPFPAELPSWSRHIAWGLLVTAAFAIFEVLLSELIHVRGAFFAIGRRARSAKQGAASNPGMQPTGSAGG